MQVTCDWEMEACGHLKTSHTAVFRIDSRRAGRQATVAPLLFKQNTDKQRYDKRLYNWSTVLNHLDDRSHRFGCRRHRQVAVNHGPMLVILHYSQADLYYKPIQQKEDPANLTKQLDTKISNKLDCQNSNQFSDARHRHHSITDMTTDMSRQE